MKHFFRNSCIRACSILGITFLYRAWIGGEGPLVRVVVFHDVVDAEWFARIVQALAEHYSVISPDEFQNGEYIKNKINVLITFDDGYASWVRVCAPILAQYNVRGLFFINSGFVDSSHDVSRMQTYARTKLLLNGPHDGITWDGVKILLEGGHTIGGHAVNHVRLAYVEEKVQKEEIGKDKAQIEKMSQKSITMFAYPFGQDSDYSKTTERAVEESGYSQAFTTESAFVRGGKRYSIPRLCIEDRISVSELYTWIEGGYDIYAWLKKICVR